MRILWPFDYLPTLKGLFRNIYLRESIYPFYASFKLTCKCHFGCPYCNVKQDPVPDLSTADIKQILRNLSRSSVLMTSFEGGEPLLRKDIGELLHYASRECAFYLLFTTSVKNIKEYPMKDYCRYIDFLHVSIDEGHDNLELFDSLEWLSQFSSQVSVQTVVTKDTVDKFEKKVEICYKNKANIVIIPAAHMDKAENHFPDMDLLEMQLDILRRKYPDTIHTPKNFFSVYKQGKCSTGSIIIAPDGRLYYPCHILGEKGPDLRTNDLMEWCQSKEAVIQRKKMRACERNCGWYQYYAINAYTSVNTVWETLRPVIYKKR